MSNSSYTQHKLQEASPCTGHLVSRDIANGEYCPAGAQINVGRRGPLVRRGGRGLVPPWSGDRIYGVPVDMERIACVVSGA